MVKRFAQKLGYLWARGDTRPATIASVLSGYLWAIFLLFSEDTLARPTYKHMSEVLPNDESWAAVFIVVASLQLWRLYATTTRKTIHYEYILKIIACAMWTFVGLSCMFSLYPPPAAMSDMLVIAFATWWDLLRLGSCRVCEEATCQSGVCPHDR